ncbi:hypothetical protein OSTOST_03652 [Ostertagia ostertagi]
MPLLKLFDLQMAEIVVRTVSGLKKARVAAVAMSCPSEIILHMDTYTSDQLRNQLLAYHPAGGEIATAQAYGLARDLLNAETTKDKSVVVFSNGQTSTCNQPLFGNKDEYDIAKKLRDGGIKFGYVGIETPANVTSLDEITQDPKKVALMNNITKLNPEDIDQTVDWLLDLLKTAPEGTTEGVTATSPALEKVTTNPVKPPISVPQSPEGTSGAGKSIVFLLDASSAALGQGWRNTHTVALLAWKKLRFINGDGPA